MADERFLTQDFNNYELLTKEEEDEEGVYEVQSWRCRACGESARFPDYIHHSVGCRNEQDEDRS